MRVYFSARDDQGRSLIGAGALDLDRPPGGLRPDPAPLLGPGCPGTFDESGVTTSCLVEHDGTRFLYYTGWTRGVTVPFYFYAGLAASGDGGRSFERVSRAPILERSEVDPFLTASPWVLVEDGGWRMWYVSCVGWEPTPNGPRHRYHIKYAESAAFEYASYAATPRPLYPVLYFRRSPRCWAFRRPERAWRNW